MKSRVAAVCAILLSIAAAAGAQAADPAKADAIARAREQAATALAAHELKAALVAYERLTDLQGSADPTLLHQLAHATLSDLQPSKTPYVSAGACVELAPETGEKCADGVPTTEAVRADLLDRQKSLGAIDRLRGGEDNTVAPLVLLLNESSYLEVQFAAAAQLGETHSDAARNALRAFVTGRPDGQVRRAAVLSLALLGDAPSLDEVRRLLPNLSGEDRVAAARALAAAGDPAAEQLFLDSAADESDSVRIQAAVQMSALAPEQARKTLRAGLASSNQWIRAASAQGYGTLNWEPSRELRAAMVDANELVRLRAAQAVHRWARSH